MILLSALTEILVAFFRTVIEIPIIWIGEIVLFLVTFGRHKPRWDRYLDSGGSDWVFLSEMSFWIGIAAICAIGGGIKLLFFS